MNAGLALLTLLIRAGKNPVLPFESELWQFQDYEQEDLQQALNYAITNIGQEQLNEAQQNIIWYIQRILGGTVAQQPNTVQPVEQIPQTDEDLEPAQPKSNLQQ